MAIITISRGSYSKGKEIAEKVAQSLGYECVSRDVLLEASEHFNIPEIKLVKALHDAPSVLERFTYGKEKYVAYIAQAFLEHVQKDNVVYHGLAGHFFLKGVGHTLKVRIIADLNDRIPLVMQREGISKQKARHFLKKVDEERRKWALALYGIDTADANLYDLIVHIHKISLDDAVNLICHTAGSPAFQTTPDSQKALDDLVLAAQVRSKVINEWPKVDVSADDGKVIVHIEAPLTKEAVISEQIVPLVKEVSGVKDAKVHVRPSAFLGSY